MLVGGGGHWKELRFQSEVKVFGPNFNLVDFSLLAIQQGECSKGSSCVLVIFRELLSEQPLRGTEPELRRQTKLQPKLFLTPMILNV